ncbi:MAG: preprotein translocase subunit SecA [Pseudomonadales bacterium]|nr:preprotein translocase subunit SecA [Pseudomonadales bacterium]
MSDLGWILTGQRVPLIDGAYAERDDRHEEVLEAFLANRVGRWLRRAPSHRVRQYFLDAVAAWEATVTVADDEALRQQFGRLALALKHEGLAHSRVAEAFALVREGARRTLGKRHHDVQILGGWVILGGRIVEMQTGEGKSLTATLPAITAAAAGASVHVVTVNDYLAARDTELMRPLYQFFGLSVSCIVEDMEPEQRRHAYACDVCYVSNKELVFDYLKDRLARRHADTRAHRLLLGLAHGEPPQRLLLRGLHMAIVDEADSVLIDEARTPLIISRTEEEGQGQLIYGRAIELARQMEANTHYRLTMDRHIEWQEAGRHFLTHATADWRGLWASPRWREEMLRQALVALLLFHRDQHYIVSQGAIQIVDESTGRVMADRTWERGLHQLIEAKEGCEISEGRETLAKMTYQRFFRRYVLLGGMTGTAREVAPELWRIYELPVVTVPTHRPPCRIRQPDCCYADGELRWKRVAERVHEIIAQGRPVLIGTRSVAASEAVAAVLQAAGIEYRILNARQDKEEAAIIAGAGEAGRVTVATNMAGRGTDIALGAGVEEVGGLHVILTEFHTSRRIDRQLIGRCGRQGDRGSAEAIVSLGDELFAHFQPRLQRRCAAWMSRHGRSELPRWMLRVLVWMAQRASGRLDARSRQMTFQSDKKQSEFLAFAGKVE